jgi:MoaA/NifB/PqqE/SkfB family radical SAM enzyme
MKNHSVWRITLDTNPEDCNYKCIMCEEHSPHSNFISNLKKTIGKSRRVLPLEMLDNVLQQALDLGVKEIIPSTMGEPLLYKYFDRIVDFCKDSDIKLNLTTNGSFPRKKVDDWASILIPITIDTKISLNSISKDLSESIMIGSKFKKVLNNIKAYIQYRDQYFSETGIYSRVTLQLTFMQNNMHEIEQIIQLGAELGVDRIKGHHLWVHFDEIEHLSLLQNFSSIKEWNQIVQKAISSRNLYPNKYGRKIILENFVPIIMKDMNDLEDTFDCPFLGKELWISAEGKISPCCAPSDKRDHLGDFGNISNTSLREAIESVDYNQLVFDYKSRELCKTCRMRKPKSQLSRQVVD